MPIKQRSVITKSDFEDALDYLGVSVSDVSKGSGVPRAYLSDLKNRGVPLRREYAEKLVEYLKGQGVEFDDDDAENADGAEPQRPESPHPRVAMTEVLYLPIRPEVVADQVRKVFEEIARNDARVSELYVRKVKRDSGGEIAGRSQDEVRELFALLAWNYVLVRHLTVADSPLEKAPEEGTLHDLMLGTFAEGVERAGVERKEAEAEA
jgi:hypothetical protein